MNFLKQTLSDRWLIGEWGTGEWGTDRGMGDVDEIYEYWSADSAF